MATFAFKYDYVAPQGFLGAGQEWTQSFGPWPWVGAALTVTAVPFRVSPAGHTAGALEVTRVFLRRSGEDRYLVATIKNVGSDRANLQVVIGGVTP
jgi:hypothetical protein